MGKNKESLCEIYGEIIFNKMPHARYCNECQNRIRDENLIRKTEKYVKPPKLMDRKFACEKSGYVGRPKLKIEIIDFIRDLDKKGIKPRDISKQIQERFRVKLHRNTILKYRLKTRGQNFTPPSVALKKSPLIHANRETSVEVSPNSNPSDLNSRGKPSVSSPSFPLRESRLA